jgi:hypothetical protein
MDIRKEVIENFMKCRNHAQTALGQVMMGSDLDEAFEVANNLYPRNNYTDAEIHERLGQLFSEFPDTNWDSENISDALYCERENIIDYVKTTK